MFFFFLSDNDETDDGRLFLFAEWSEDERSQRKTHSRGWGGEEHGSDWLGLTPAGGSPLLKWRRTRAVAETCTKKNRHTCSLTLLCPVFSAWRNTKCRRQRELQHCDKHIGCLSLCARLFMWCTVPLRAGRATEYVLFAIYTRGKTLFQNIMRSQDLQNTKTFKSFRCSVFLQIC